MDWVLSGGRVHLVDPYWQTVEAVGIRGNRVVAVGDDESVLSLASHATRRLDLGGAVVVPGLIDSHLHLIKEADIWGRVVLKGAASVAEVCDRLADRAATLAPGAWVLASPFWHEASVAERRFPTRAELDRACPNHPVQVPRGMHRMAVNTQALRAAGITADTTNPVGGRIERDDQGEPTGMLFSSAQDMVMSLLPELTLGERAQAIEVAMRRYSSLGLTGLREPGTDPVSARALQLLWEKQAMALRVNMMPRVLQPVSIEQALDCDRIIDHIRTMPVRTGYGDPWLRVGALKMLLDGALEAAWMREPYVGLEGRGIIRLTLEELDRVLSVIADEGWSLAMHVSGDAVMDEFLASVRRVNRDHDVKPLRWTVEHAFFCEPDQCRSMKSLGLIPAVHMALHYDFGPAMVANWGRDRADRLTPVGDMVDAGLQPAGGSDGPFVDISPLRGMQWLMTREAGGAGVFGADQAIDARTALLAYTKYNAYTTFEEQIKGSLEPGKLADLVVLDRDILSCPPEDVGATSVLMTMVDGTVMHRDGI